MGRTGLDALGLFPYETTVRNVRRRRGCLKITSRGRRFPAQDLSLAWKTGIDWLCGVELLRGSMRSRPDHASRPFPPVGDLYDGGRLRGRVPTHPSLVESQLYGFFVRAFFGSDTKIGQAEL